MTPLASPLQPRWRRRLAGSAPLILTLLGLSLLIIAACGGGASPSSVAIVGKTTGRALVGCSVTAPARPAGVAKHYPRALKFSECMQADGLADFPDLSSSRGIRLTSK